MNSNTKLSCAIAAILSSSYVGAARAAATPDTPEPEGIQEIVVTAQRRAENSQDVPITIQALTANTLTQLNVSTFDQFVKYLPNVTQAGAGPGQNNIYMRGLSIGAQGSQSSGIVGQIPNVAVYLDDQSAALPGRNLDVYAVDMERIEVLEGPQGTLFGSGAEAGVLRYITNKPRLDVTEGNVNAGYSYTAHGDPNSNVDATINVPLIPEVLAARAVVYSDRRGGYINNVPGTFTRSSTDLGIARGNGGVLPTDNVAIDNFTIASNAINPVTYQGFRFSVLGHITDDWSVLVAQSYQNMDAEGVFYQMPYASEGTTFDSGGRPIGSQLLPPRSVTLFNPSYDKDRFENTALTVTGRISELKLVYSASYLDRHVEQNQDYTNYSRGVYGSYYQCAGISPSSVTAGKCYTPSATWHDTERNTHQSHEIRLSTSEERRARAIFGLYYERFVINDDTEFLYRSVPNCTPALNVDCFNPVQPWAGSYTSNPGVRNDRTGFLDDVQRTIDQKAAFGSVDIDLIPKQLTLTFGTRYYRFNEKEVGGDVGSFFCKVYSPTNYFGPCLAPYGTNLNTQDPNTSRYSGFRSRANLSWKVTDDALLYYTWSQGFRPGGFNRGTSGHLPTTPGDPSTNQFITPATYAPDTLINNELGFKTIWFNRRFEINGALYQEDWHNAQVNFFDPQGGLGNLTFATNGANYRVRGVELQLVVKPIEGLTIQGSSAWNSSNQQNSPYLINNNSSSPGYGQPITSIPNPYGPINSPLANSPPLQFALRIRQDYPIGEYLAFVQAAAQHTGNSYSATGYINSYAQPGYTTYDAAAGVSKGAWNVQLFAQNLTDVNASTYTSSNPQVLAQVITRPRVAGIRFGYGF